MRFLTGSLAVLNSSRTLLQHIDTHASGALFLSAFPMFVPSLSWQNDRF
jgi:hypothetical protein